MKYVLISLFLLFIIVVFFSFYKDEEVRVPGSEDTSYYRKGNTIYFYYTNNLMPFLPIRYKTKMKMDADAETFVAINERFAKDKNHVFYLKGMIDISDSKSFTIDSNEIYRDKFNIYLFENLGWRGTLTPVEDADIETYHKIPGILNWTQDKNCVYYKGKKVKGADSKSFVALTDFITKDKNYIFVGDATWGKIYKYSGEVDIKTFSYDSKTKTYFDKNGSWKFKHQKWVKKP